MYWVYVLESQVNYKLYIGSTSDPERRFKFHNLGKSRWTKVYLPWKLISKTDFPSKTIALKIEKKLKNYKNPKYISSCLDGKEFPSRILN